MRPYIIDKLTKEEIFGGRTIGPLRQWLKSQEIELKNYDYNAEMAVITHYLMNRRDRNFNTQVEGAGYVTIPSFGYYIIW